MVKSIQGDGSLFDEVYRLSSMGEGSTIQGSFEQGDLRMLPFRLLERHPSFIWSHLHISKATERLSRSSQVG
jgi:hypothetical protein